MHTFYYSTGTCATASHIALEEAGIPFKGIEVSWSRNLNVSELSSVNPMAQVPVLVTPEGRVLTQSMAILEYIAQKSAAKKLMPAHGTWEYSQALSWLAFAAADYHKSFYPIFRASKWTADEKIQAEIKKSAVEGIEKALEVLNAGLASKDFILGANFSVADSYLFVVTGWCKFAQIKISKYSNLSAYMKRVYDRAAVQKVLKAEDLLSYLPE